MSLNSLSLLTVQRNCTPGHPIIISSHFHSFPNLEGIECNRRDRFQSIGRNRDRAIPAPISETSIDWNRDRLGIDRIPAIELRTLIVHTFSFWSLRVTADRSLAGYRQPFVRRLFQPSTRRFSTSHSQVSTGHLRVIAGHSFASFCASHSHLSLLVIAGRCRPFIRRLLPTIHSQVFYRPFADYCRPLIHGHRFLQVTHESPAAADHSFTAISSQAFTGYSSASICFGFCQSFTGHCQTLYHRLLPIKQAAVTLSLYLTRTSL